MSETAEKFAVRCYKDKWQVMWSLDGGRGGYLDCANKSDAEAIAQAPVLERRFDMGERTAEFVDALERTAKALRRTETDDFTARHFDQMAADAMDASS